MAGVSKLAKSATVALSNYMGLDEEESLLIVSDEGSREIGLALFEAGKTLCEEALYMEMPKLENDGDEPPDIVAGLMKDVDVVVCPTTASLMRTYAVKAAAKLGVRVAVMPTVSPDAVMRGLSADPKKIAKQTESLRKVTYGVSHVRITSDAGTDLKLLIKKRKIVAQSGVYMNIGDYGELPAGEVMLAPIEGKTNGKLVVDGSITGYGVLENPVTMTIKSGYAERIAGKEEAKDLSKKLSKIGKEARAIGVFGMGTNYKAKLEGSMSEDTKVLGSLHIGLGNNKYVHGKIDVDSKIDCVIKNPTIVFDDETIIEDGILLIK